MGDRVTAMLGKVSGSAVKVYMVLLRWQDGGGGLAPVEAIAAAAGMHRHTARRALAELETTGFLRRGVGVLEIRGENVAIV